MKSTAPVMKQTSNAKMACVFLWYGCVMESLTVQILMMKQAIALVKRGSFAVPVVNVFLRPAGVMGFRIAKIDQMKLVASAKVSSVNPDFVSGDLITDAMESWIVKTFQMKLIALGSHVIVSARIRFRFLHLNGVMVKTIAMTTVMRKTVCVSKAVRFLVKGVALLFVSLAFGNAMDTRIAIMELMRQTADF